MLTTLLLILASGAGGSTAVPGNPRLPGAAHFRIVLESSPTGFTARCDTGCFWRTLTYNCGSNCLAVLDVHGVRGGPATARPDAAFGFRIQGTASGWTAESLGGTFWNTLSYGCWSSRCRARVDEHGVTGLGRN